MLEDTKQEKVLNKIKGSLVHGNEGQLGTKNNDECYTKETDILAELSYWANLGKFQGKNIVCPCDWDIVGNKTTNEYGILEYRGKTYKNVYGITITYDTDKFALTTNNVYKCIKKAEFMGEEYVEDDPNTPDSPNFVEPVKVEIAEEDVEDFLRGKLTCNFIKVLSQNARRWGIKSITASGYNPAANNGKGAGTPFQNVDYSKYDVCITNPPFSLYPEFMKAIVGHINFVVLAPFMNRTNPCIGVPLMTGQAYLGVGRHLALAFANPTKKNNYSGEKSVACDWIVNYPEAQADINALHFKSGLKFASYADEYALMPNMIMKDIRPDTKEFPIRVNTSTYPDDYTGWMFGAVSVLDNLDQDTYEWYMTHCTGYLNNNPDISPFAVKIKEVVMLKGADGKGNFGGIIFRKKPEVK